MSRNVLNAMSIDVEDWFHILEVEQVPAQADWAGLPSVVERNTERLLGLLEETGSGCTGFLLGWIAEHHPQLAKRVAEAGCEIATHGYAHELVREIGPERFRADVERSIDVIEGVTGRRPVGYRAPGFSITEDARDWAFEVLADLGMSFDSSIFPGRSGHGGIAGADARPHAIAVSGGRQVQEFPISVTSLFGRDVAFGGGYLRLLPYRFLKARIEQANREGVPVVVYVHPRDIDPDHPRIDMPLPRRFRSYVGLHTAYDKLRRLLEEFRFGTISDSLREAA